MTREELVHASTWWSDEIRKQLPTNPSLADAFQKSLILQMENHYEGHWYESDSSKGSAFRSISFDCNRMDPILLRAAKAVGIDKQKLEQLLNNCRYKIMFVNPGEVKIHNAVLCSESSEYIYRRGGKVSPPSSSPSSPSSRSTSSSPKSLISSPPSSLPSTPKPSSTISKSPPSHPSHNIHNGNANTNGNGHHHRLSSPDNNEDESPFPIPSSANSEEYYYPNQNNNNNNNINNTNALNISHIPPVLSHTGQHRVYPQSKYFSNRISHAPLPVTSPTNNNNNNNNINSNNNPYFKSRSYSPSAPLSSLSLLHRVDGVNPLSSSSPSLSNTRLSLYTSN